MALDGLLLVDKVTGPTSHDVVAEVRRRLGQKSVGHAGTLDPMASGLLVLLLGEATKVSNYILGEDKGYEVRVRFGLETDTWDTTGQVLTEENVDLAEAQIRQTIEGALGDLDLPVPSFSAIKVDGQKLYEKAREGQALETPIRRMRFYGAEILECAKNEVRVRVRCSKGGYVRSWAYELGRRLGSFGTVSELRRMASHPYDISAAVRLDSWDERRMEKGFIPLSEVLPEWPSVFVEGQDRKLLLNGQISHGLMGRLRPYGSQYKDLGKGLKVKGLSDRNLLAILHPNDRGIFQITRVFNNTPARS